MSPERSKPVHSADPTELRLVITKVGSEQAEVEGEQRRTRSTSMRRSKRSTQQAASVAAPGDYTFHLRVGSTQVFPDRPTRVSAAAVLELVRDRQRAAAPTAFLREHLQEIEYALGLFADRSDVRLWVHYPAELDPIAWESLGHHATYDGWMVVRVCQRPEAAQRPRRDQRPLRKVLVVIGDVRQSFDAPNPGPVLVELVQKLEERLVGRELVTLTASASHDLCPSDWTALRSVQKDARIGSKVAAIAELEKHRDADALIVIAHAVSTRAATSPDDPSAAEPGGQATAFQLAAGQYLECEELARALNAARGSTPRLALLLGCNAGYHMAAELHAVVDHVIGFRTRITPTSAATIAERAIQAFLRPNSATVAEVVRDARGVLRPEREPDGSSRASSPAHWCPTGVDEPFVDAIADTVARMHGRLVRALDTFENRGHTGDAERLTRIHVPLRVVARRTDEEDLDTDGSRRWRERETGRDFLGLVLEREGDGRLALQPGITVVHGKPGSGKTTSARELTRQLAGGRFGVLALFARLPDLMVALAEPDMSLALDGIVAFVRTKTPGLADIPLEDCQHAARAMRAQGRLVLVLDGLDEVRDPAQNNQARELVSNLETDAASPIAILVTTRPSGYVDITGARLQVEIDELGTEQQVELLTKWNQVGGGTLRVLDKDAAERKARSDLAALKSGGRSAGLLALFRVPLFLGLVARKLASDPRATVAATRVHTFYDEMLRDAATVPYRQGATALCTAIQFPTALARLESVAMFALERADPEREFGFAWDEAAGELERLGLCRAGESTEFMGQALYAGIFVSSDVGDDRFLPGSVWRFWHRAFQESLGSSVLARIPTHSELVVRAKALLATGERARATWEEPFVLLSSRLAAMEATPRSRSRKRASAWVKHLLGDPTTRTLGRRAVAMADDLDAKVVVVAIRKFMGWPELSALYDHLRSPSSRGGDPEVVKAVIARGTKHRDAMRRYDDAKHRIEVELAAALLAERSSIPGHEGSNQLATVPHSWLRSEASLPVHAFAVCHSERAKESDGSPLPWLVEVPAGAFTMGADPTDRGRSFDEGPWPNVSVGTFWIAREAITVAQYLRFDPAKDFRDDGDDLPARGISWFEASLYCRALTRWAIDHPEAFQSELAMGGELHQRLQLGHLVFRLPKEAELEYVMRWTAAGPGTHRGPYGVAADGFEITSGNLKKYAVFGVLSESISTPNPVGSRLPTTPGRLFDLHGNVREWCLDAYEYEAPRVAADTVHGGPPVASRVLRGGSFRDDASWCRASIRQRDDPKWVNGTYGFRVVLAPPLSPLR
jgi:formylglycine-generating enzyme required for sulfatase activity